MLPTPSKSISERVGVVIEIISLSALPLSFFKWRSSMSSTSFPLSILTSRMSKSLSLPSAVTMVLEDWRISMLATTEDSMAVNGVTSNWSVAERDDWAPVVLQLVKNTASSARVIVVFIIYILTVFTISTLNHQIIELSNHQISFSEVQGFSGGTRTRSWLGL